MQVADPSTSSSEDERWLQVIHSVVGVVLAGALALIVTLAGWRVADGFGPAATEEGEVTGIEQQDSDGLVLARLEGLGSGFVREEGTDYYVRVAGRNEHWTVRSPDAYEVAELGPVDVETSLITGRVVGLRGEGWGWDESDGPIRVVWLGVGLAGISAIAYLLLRYRSRLVELGSAVLALVAISAVAGIGAATFVAFDSSDAAPASPPFEAFSPSVWSNPVVERSELGGGDAVPVGRRVEIGPRDWLVQVVSDDDLLVDAGTESAGISVLYLVPVTTERLGGGPVAKTPRFVLLTSTGDEVEPEKGLGCPSNPAPYEPVEPGSGVSAGFLCFSVEEGDPSGSVVEIGGPEDPLRFETSASS